VKGDQQITSAILGRKKQQGYGARYKAEGGIGRVALPKINIVTSDRLLVRFKKMTSEKLEMAVAV
jgi:hypothetical protein